jgi:thiamine biosynthesis lipoprotein
MAELVPTSFPALGTTVVVAADRPKIERTVEEVRRELEHIDRTCSRFRDDSDLSRVNAAEGRWTNVDALLITAVEVALRAAEATGGLVDPTVGSAMIRLGYDRDFRDIPHDGPPIPTIRSTSIAMPDWRRVEIHRDHHAIRIPLGLALDLGSTAKALAADRAADRAATSTGTGVLVALGGDVAVAGDPPAGGWTVGIAEDHAAVAEPGETVSIASGGLATSSTTVRRWSRGDVPVHHVLDPRTGLPASVIWRTVSVCAATCVDANAASTAAIILGEQAREWLARRSLPARLVGRDGEVIRVARWPEPVVA